MSQMEMLEAARREYHKDEVQLEVLKILEPGNEFLQDVVDQFGKTQRQANKVQIACFYELKASNVGKIVGKQNRKVGSGWTARLTNSDHLDRDSWSVRALAVSTYPIRQANSRSRGPTLI